MQKEFLDFNKLEQLHQQARIISELRELQIPLVQQVACAILSFAIALERKIRRAAQINEVLMYLPIHPAEQRLLITQASKRGLNQQGAVAKKIARYLRQEFS